MTLGEFRAATRNVPDSAEITVLNTWDGQSHDIDDGSVTDAAVTIEVCMVNE